MDKGDILYSTADCSAIIIDIAEITELKYCWYKICQ